ncbi:MAG: SDR family NAD(P)-dependent oxidoreductase [Acetobacteraceae bacterium]
MIPRRSGRIINVASIAGKGYEGASNAAYAASKGAVISLTKTASQQLARHDITVNAVCPGVTRTELSDANLHVRVSVEEMERRRAAVIPLKRVNDHRGHCRDGGVPGLRRCAQYTPASRSTSMAA